MDRLQAMSVFVKIAETRSFAAAARQLGLSAASVTRAIAGLEAAIGARLLVRTTRSTILTEAGDRFLEDSVRILGDLAEAEAAAGGRFARPVGTLTVTAPVMFGQEYVLPLLLEFLAQHPDVSARTLFVDRIVNLVDEGADIAVRIGHLPDSGFSAIRVGTVRRVIVAAPAYLDKHGIPATPADLSSHAIIAATSAWASTEWRFGKDGKQILQIRPRLFCNTNPAAIQAAIAGWGITRVLSYQVASAVAAGELQTVLTGYGEEPLPVHIVHPSGRHAPAKVRRFIDFAVRRLQAISWSLDEGAPRSGADREDSSVKRA
jgi:DNA-binding transcriptional LysR family regulator